MKKKVTFFTWFLLLGFFNAFAQENVVSGKVTDQITGETMRGVSVMIKETSEMTQTNQKGEFSFKTKQQFPLTIILSHSGFTTYEINVNDASPISAALVSNETMADVMVYSATRTAVKTIRTPITVDRFGTRHIVNNAGTSYYDLAALSKGAGETTAGFLFKTISTRGFNGSGSTRVNQLVDGMDNQAPGLNFFVGNFAGLTELDVENIEILPGASSALYGPGGMNGTILINSKNPFKHQGLSVLAKQGVMHVDKRQRENASSFSDYSLRYAKAFNRFAFKIGVQYINATDWVADDSSNYSRSGNIGKVIPGTRQTDPNYDGVNVYGDETSVNFTDILRQVLPAGHPELVPETYVSRTGYEEKDVIDPKTSNTKLSGALHYKITDKIEAQLMGYWAKGNTVYTGNNRYVFKDINIGQYKFEVNHPNWYVRSYTTQEDAGEAYSATVTTQIFNEAWKPSTSWYPQYTGAYLQARGMGADRPTAHNIARSFADQGRPVAGSDAFNQIFDQVRKIPIPQGGRFLEKSQLWQTEGQYDFSKSVKFVDIIVGANIKNYILDSKGTLFIDSAAPIKIAESGAYAQATKRLFNDVVTLSVSGRYDKNEDFKGKFTPRATALFRVAKDNYLRTSFQTAYKFPSTQQKYIKLNVGDYELLGGLPWVMEYMQTKSSPVVELINGVPAPTPYVYKELKPEIMKSFEVGYKGLIANKLMVDAYGYWGEYKDFLGRNVLFQPGTGKIFSTVVNSTTKVKTHGFGVGMDYQLPKQFTLFMNVYSDVITDVPSGFQSYFNTPKIRLNGGFGNTGLGKNKTIGFNVVVRWQDEFMWDGELANGPIESIFTTDAQVSYKFKNIKSQVKLGGTNIFNKYYKNAFGNPEIGGLYYISLGYNIL